MKHVSNPLDAAAHIRQIVMYYEDTYLDYRVWWMSAAALAMHYGFWDEQTRNHADAQLNMNRVLAAQAELKPNDHVLDAGCGVGGQCYLVGTRIRCSSCGHLSAAKRGSPRAQVCLAARCCQPSHL
jgi:cyclopropane fatty-acyl-phospholipid synthase-like methyltransferase